MAYLDKLEGSRSRQDDEGRHLDSRPKTEDILQFTCPVCAAQPMQFCDRSDWHPRSSSDQALKAAGTPRSHQQRKWLAQNHNPSALAGMDPGGQPGWRAGRSDMMTTDPAKALASAVADVSCPVHDVPRGTHCPEVAAAACISRVRKWMLADRRKDAKRGKRVAAGKARRRHVPPPLIPGTHRVAPSAGQEALPWPWEVAPGRPEPAALQAVGDVIGAEVSGDADSGEAAGSARRADRG